jgi:hypothetical protein
MKTYSQLGHVYRTEPCVEYPGQWAIYMGDKVIPYPSLVEAKQAAYSNWGAYGEEWSVCWKCSDNDPRQGEIWFTSFYQDGQR